MSEQRKRVNPLFLREDSLRLGIELLHSAMREYKHQLAPCLRGHNMNASHYRILSALARHSGMAGRELAECLGISKQGLAQIIRELSQAGLITAQVDVKDRRRRKLRLTETGMACESEFFNVLRDLIANAYQEAGAEAVEGFHQVLRALRRE